jgi:hypothetical protein
VLDGRHEPLVDQKTFDLAQARVRRDATLPGRLLGRSSVLSGRLICAGCGRRLTVFGSNGTRRFRCPGRYASDLHVDARTCERGVGTPRESDVLDAILEALREETEKVTVEPARIRSAVAEQMTRVETIEGQLRNLDAALGKLAADHALGRKSDAAFELGSRHIEHERTEKSAALDGARADLARVTAAESASLSNGKRRVLRSVVDLWDPTDEEGASRILTTWFDRVYVRRGRTPSEPINRRIRIDRTL